MRYHLFGKQFVRSYEVHAHTLDDNDDEHVTKIIQPSPWQSQSQSPVTETTPRCTESVRKSHLEGLACACAIINFLSNACNNGCHAFNGLCILCMVGHGFCLIRDSRERVFFFLEKRLNFFRYLILVRWVLAHHVFKCVSEAESHPYYITNVFYSHF